MAKSKIPNEKLAFISKQGSRRGSIMSPAVTLANGSSSTKAKPTHHHTSNRKCLLQLNPIVSILNAKSSKDLDTWYEDDNI